MYIQLDLDYWDHPKTIDLVTAMGPGAEAYPLRLWTWAAKYEITGNFKSEAAVERACRWTGEAGSLCRKLVLCGFLDLLQGGGGFQIHNWNRRTGEALGRYEEKKERNRDYQRKKRGVSGKLPDGFRKVAPKSRVEERRVEERNIRNHPSGDSSPEQSPAIASGAPPPPLLQGLTLFLEDRKLLERFPSLLPEWRAAYPGVDIGHELKKAHSWQRSDPRRKKKNQTRFLNAWLSRAQDQASRGVHGVPFVQSVPRPPEAACDRCGSNRIVETTVERNGESHRAMMPCPKCRPGTVERRAE